MTHAITSMAGAVGCLHRNFWPDLPLCLTDRYAGHLGHLQYRLHRQPSTKLVMDLLACQEELNIVIQITQQQLDMISQLQSLISSMDPKDDSAPTIPAASRRYAYRTSVSTNPYADASSELFSRATYRQIGTSTLNDPLAQLIDNLQRELADLQDLRDNANTLINRTIQLVNIRLEDHGKAILVFTVVTIIFLPLNFVSSFFGINTSDIRDMAATQSLFWAVAVSVTTGVVGASILLAFKGGDLVEKVHVWRDRRRERAFTTGTNLRQAPGTSDGFRSVDPYRVDSFRA